MSPERFVYYERCETCGDRLIPQRMWRSWSLEFRREKRKDRFNRKGARNCCSRCLSFAAHHLG